MTPSKFAASVLGSVGCGYGVIQVSKLINDYKSNEEKKRFNIRRQNTTGNFTNVSRGIPIPFTQESSTDDLSLIHI